MCIENCQWKLEMKISYTITHPSLSWTRMPTQCIALLKLVVGISNLGIQYIQKHHSTILSELQRASEHTFQLPFPWNNNCLSNKISKYPTTKSYFIQQKNSLDKLLLIWQIIAVQIIWICNVSSNNVQLIRHGNQMNMKLWSLILQWDWFF